jgi:hypothetical protein
MQHAVDQVVVVPHQPLSLVDGVTTELVLCHVVVVPRPEPAQIHLPLTVVQLALVQLRLFATHLHVVLLELKSK